MTPKHIHDALTDRLDTLLNKYNTLAIIQHVAPDLAALIDNPMSRASDHLYRLNNLADETPSQHINELFVAGLSLLSCEINDAAARLQGKITPAITRDIINHVTTSSKVIEQ